MIVPDRNRRPVIDPEAGDLLNRRVLWLGVMTLITLTGGMLAYGERFSFWDTAFSHLGGVRTRSGNPNLLSWMLFSAGMLSCGILCLAMGSLKNELLHLLFRICGIGYMIMLVPYDVSNPVHAVGAALVIGALWFYCVIVLNNLHSGIPRPRWWGYQALLHGTVLPYALLYVLNSSYERAVQKLAIAGLIIVMKFSTGDYVKLLQKNGVSRN